MEATAVNFAPQVYGYRPKVTSSSMGGAFGTTMATSQQQQHQQHQQIMSRVDIPFKANLGLFHE